MEERRDAKKKALDAKSARLKEWLERESTLRNIKGLGEWQNETKESIQKILPIKLKKLPVEESKDYV